MCKSNFEYLDLKDLNDLPDLSVQDLQNSSFLGVIMPIVETMFATGVFSINMLLVNAIYRDFVSSSSLDQMDARTYKETKSINTNIYNYAIAKAVEFAAQLGKAKRLGLNDKKNSLTNLFFNQYQGVEKRHVAKTTKIITAKVNSKVLRYRSDGDDNVRPEHRKADGITLRSDDPFWEGTGFKLLGQINCRCTVQEVFEDTKMVRKNVAVPNDEAVSKFDGEKVLVFQEDFGYFDKNKNITRRVFRKYE